ncbi:MAG: hypothetical protein HOE48_00380 [Candidatus Latescibacteria bacterium]|nr:hypothetical protein [Candidatus Latescibacterota bacterium]
MLSAPLFADRFAGRPLRVDTRVGTELSPINDGISDLPILVADDIFDIELFVEGGRGGRTGAFTVAFENSGNNFGEHFVIERIRGILPQADAPGPTTVKACADRPAIVPQSGYFATITLRAKKDIPAGLQLRFHSTHTTITDDNTSKPDILSVGNTIVVFGRPNYNLFLDLDTAPGNQGIVEATGLSTTNGISVQVFGESIRFMTGFILRFEYDDSQLKFEDFIPGPSLPRAQTLDPVGTLLDSPLVEIEVTAASFSGSANVEDGLLGTLLFQPSEYLTRTGLVMSGAEIRRGGTFNPFFTPLSVEFSRLDADFDKDGSVGFRDFLLFAEHFGSERGQDRYDPAFDLLPDSNINFADFVLFTESLSFFKVTVLD